MAESEIAAVRNLLLSKPRPTDLAARRERMDGFGQRYPVPPDVRVDTVDAGGVRAEWTTTPGAHADRVLVFLHGGGYISGSLASHRHSVARMGREARARTLALDYRLAPEHPFPSALDDALGGYRFLRATGIEPGAIAIVGESAGGGLALALLLRLREGGETLPACLWLCSPWVDLALTGASLTTKAEVGPLLQEPYLAELAKAYLNGTDPRDPLASPLYADLRGLPPTLVQVGSAETLLDDAVRIAGAAGAADVPTTLRIWPHMIHAWHLFHPQLAEGRAALAEGGRFVGDHLTAVAR